jgi:hypothetical protein
MSTLGLGETLSDVSGVADVADVEMHDIQESGTASTSTKKRTSTAYQYFTWGTDGRWHCKQCK